MRHHYRILVGVTLIACLFPLVSSTGVPAPSTMRFRFGLLGLLPQMQTGSEHRRHQKTFL